MALVEEAAYEAVVLLEVEDHRGGHQAHHEEQRRGVAPRHARPASGSGTAAPCRATRPAAVASGSPAGRGRRPRAWPLARAARRCAARDATVACVARSTGPITCRAPRISSCGVLDPLAQLADLALERRDLHQQPVDVAPGREVEQVQQPPGRRLGRPQRVVAQRLQPARCPPRCRGGRRPARSSGLARAWTARTARCHGGGPLTLAVPTRSASATCSRTRLVSRTGASQVGTWPAPGRETCATSGSRAHERSAVPLVGDDAVTAAPHDAHRAAAARRLGSKRSRRPARSSAGTTRQAWASRRMPRASRSATRSPRSISPRRTARRTSGLTHRRGDR